MKKRGLLAFEKVVSIILIILGMVLILAFLYNFFSTADIDREVCHDSVIIRATVPTIAQGYVPLKCQTEKICITGKILGKGNCEEFANVKGVKTMRVSNSEKGLNQIQKVYAEEMVECWNMMGRGKASIFSQAAATYFGVGDVYPVCVICSRIAIDKESLDKVNFENMNLDNYMKTRAVPGTTKSYFDFMVGEGYAQHTIDPNLKLPMTETKIVEGTQQTNAVGEEGEVNVGNLEGGGELTAETAILFMQITAPDREKVIRNTLVSMVGVGGYVPGAMKIVKIVGGKVTLGLAVIFGAYQQASITINRAVTAGYCGDVEFGSDARDGCSVVRTTNYDLESISKYCEVIEGLP
ncbi:MAG: hypothetical protein U9Q06_00270 [Nanoarchaeota archaeon]|nr:hypothetical protein [Nanoarchaeota archaeon]